MSGSEVEAFLIVGAYVLSLVLRYPVLGLTLLGLTSFGCLIIAYTLVKQ